VVLTSFRDKERKVSGGLNVEIVDGGMKSKAEMRLAFPQGTRSSVLFRTVTKYGCKGSRLGSNTPALIFLLIPGQLDQLGFTYRYLEIQYCLFKISYFGCMTANLYT